MRLFRRPAPPPPEPIPPGWSWRFYDENESHPGTPGVNSDPADIRVTLTHISGFWIYMGQADDPTLRNPRAIRYAEQIRQLRLDRAREKTEACRQPWPITPVVPDEPPA